MTSKPFKLIEEALESEFYPDELSAYKATKAFFSKPLLKKHEIIVYYPGAGTDALFPAIFLDMLTESQKLHIVMVDPGYSLMSILPEFCKLTASKPVKQDSKSAIFLFKDKAVKLTYHSQDALHSLPEELKGGYDIYFERGFDIIRAAQPLFEAMILSALNKENLVIADAYLNTRSLKKLRSNKEIKNLGFYKNLEIYRKKEK